MTIRIYNTLSREKQVFEPLNPKRVTMYVCGPTVYNYAHIGNARPAVIFDLLYRLLNLEYETVVYARNITDVDDKINEAAAALGVPISEISTRYADAYHADMAAIGSGLPEPPNSCFGVTSASGITPGTTSASCQNSSKV